MLFAEKDVKRVMKSMVLGAKGLWTVKRVALVCSTQNQQVQSGIEIVHQATFVGKSFQALSMS